MYRQLESPMRKNPAIRRFDDAASWPILPGLARGAWMKRSSAPAPVFFTEVVDRHAQTSDHRQACHAGGDPPAQGCLAGGEVSYGESADSADEEAAEVSGVINGRKKIGDEPDE